MDAVIEAELHAIAEDARAQEASARSLAERTERLLATLRKRGSDSPESDLKRPDGRLTEAGVAAVNAAFDAGKTVTQVAKQFDIHVSAASNRRTIWKASKA
ncbi:hypothetical protein ACXIT0_24870 [Methylorubrum extorquens]